MRRDPVSSLFKSCPAARAASITTRRSSDAMLRRNVSYLRPVRMPVSVRIHAPAALTWLQAADADILDIHTRSLRRWRARYVVGGNANPSVAGTAATSTYARRDHGVTLSYRCVWLALGLGL